jgi:AcrR family transcriptional regulator
MLTTTRDAGRPRTYEDDAFFTATWSVLAREGHSRLTLAAVADRLGCTAPALSKRFGSKRGLLLGFAEWSYRAAEERLRRAQDLPGGPLTRLTECVVQSVSEQAAEWHGPRGLANHFVFHIETATDAELNAIWLRLTQLYERAFAGWLRDARAAGELSSQCDVVLTARVLYAGLTGAAVRWTAEPETSIEARYREVLSAVLDPHRTAA